MGAYYQTHCMFNICVMTSEQKTFVNKMADNDISAREEKNLKINR